MRQVSHVAFLSILQLIFNYFVVSSNPCVYEIWCCNIFRICGSRLNGSTLNHQRASDWPIDHIGNISPRRKYPAKDVFANMKNFTSIQEWGLIRGLKLNTNVLKWKRIGPNFDQPYNPWEVGANKNTDDKTTWWHDHKITWWGDDMMTRFIYDDKATKLHDDKMKMTKRQNDMMTRWKQISITWFLRI